MRQWHLIVGQHTGSESRDTRSVRVETVEEEEVTWGSRFILYQTHNFSIPWLTRECPWVQETIWFVEGREWKTFGRGQCYQVKNHSFFRCKVFFTSVHTLTHLAEQQENVRCLFGPQTLLSSLGDVQKSRGSAQVWVQCVTVYEENRVFTQRKRCTWIHASQSALGAPALLTLVTIRWRYSHHKHL